MKHNNSVFLVFSVTITVMLLLASSVKSENLTLTIFAGDYQITSVTEKGFSTIGMEGFGAVTIPGAPQLPARTFLIAVPPGANVNHVEVIGKTLITVPGTFKINPAKLMLRGEKSEVGFAPQDVQNAEAEYQQNYNSIYLNDHAYPEQVAEYLGQGQWRKYRYIRVRFYPFQYYPRSGRLTYYSTCTVSIDYTLPIEGSPEWQKVQNSLCDNVLDDIIAQRIINFQQARAWYQPSVPRLPHQNHLEKYDYLVIVEDNTMRNIVDQFKQWKEKIGHSVKVVTLDSIFANISGNDEAEQIWNIIRDNYSGEHWGIRYVLLIGDVNRLPIRFLFPSDTAWPYASDYYYAKLTKPWDVDNDNKWGEFTDDNLDATPDVLVGRIPHNEPSVVYTILSNIIQFEQDTDAWKRKALLPMGIMDYRQSGKTDVAVLAEYLKTHIFDPQGWTYTTLYEKNGISPSTFTSDMPLTETNFLASLGTKVQGVIDISAHGSPTHFGSQVWFQDIDHNGVHDPKTELTWNNFSDINSIPANLLSITFLCGCSTGPPCNVPSGSITSSWQISRTPLRNLGRAYLINGAPAVIASSAGSDYSPNWTSPADGNWNSLNFYFFDNLINNNMRAGDAFYAAQLKYATNHGLQRGMRVFNFLGDPSLTLLGFDNRPGGTDVVIHDGVYYDFAADNADNGDMYVAVLTTNPITAFFNGEIKIYKSADHGVSWSLWNTIQTRVGIRALDIIVAEYGSGEFVDNRLLVFFTQTDGTIQVYRFPLAGGMEDRVQIAAETVDDKSWEITVARDPVPHSFRLYLTYTLSNDSNWPNIFKIKVCRSLNNGKTWQDWDSYNDYFMSWIEAGPNNHVYLTATEESADEDIICFTSTDGGENWGQGINLTANDGANHHDLSFPVVAASSDAAIPTVWVVYPYGNNVGKYDIRYAYSQDAGSNWTKNQIFAANVQEEGLFHLKSYKTSPNRWINAAYIPNREVSANTNVMWQWASGSAPGKWSTPRIVNDFQASNGYLPRVIYSPGAPATGSGVVYANIDNKIYFSAPWLPGKRIASDQSEHHAMDIKVLSAGDSVMFQFENSQPGPVTILVHDAVGKLVTIVNKDQAIAGIQKLLWDGRDRAGYPVSSGNYLCTMKTSQSSTSREFKFKSTSSSQTLHKQADVNWVETADLEGAFITSAIVAVNAAEFYAAAVTANNEMLNHGVVFHSPDDGEHWQRTADLPDCWSLNCLLLSPEDVLFAGGMALIENHAMGIIYRSDNGGQSWTPVLSFPDGMVYKIIRTNEGALLAATGWNGIIFKSDNGGAEWFPIAELGENVHIYSIMQAANGLLFAGLEMPEHNAQIWRSETGMEWFPSEGWDGVIAVYDVLEAHDQLFAGVKAGDMGWVYQSDLNGEQWARTAEFMDTNIKAVPCLLLGPKEEIYAGTEMILGPSFTSVYMKPAEAEQWTQYGGSIDLANTIYALARTSRMIYAGSGFVYGNIYKCVLETGVEEPAKPSPSQFDLAQNYPNPFNSQTRINYQLADNGSPVDVSLKIIDLLGREIKTLVDEKKKSGHYSVVWNATDEQGKQTAGGVYFVQMKAGDFVKTMKILYLK